MESDTDRFDTIDVGNVDDLDTLQADMPEIYEFQFMPSDVQKTFTDILKDVSIGEVFNVFSDYVGSNIEPIGWKGIWKPTSSEYPDRASFRVEVVDVYYKTLEASVVIMDMIYPKPENVPKEYERVLTLLQRNEVFTVPLIDLYVIVSPDDDTNFHDTAYLIDLTRFFFKNIWRPWDDFEEANLDEDFASTLLAPRMTLLWDMRNKIISSNFINRFDAILKEAFAIKEKIIQLNLRAAQNGNIENDDGDYALESDVLEFVQLKMKLQDLKKEMEIIEDPIKRSIYYNLLPEQSNEESDQKAPFVHLVSKNFTLNLLFNFMQQLSGLLEENKQLEWPMKFHTTLQKAIISAKSGDAIYLSPGTYGQPLSWIENDIEIIGIDDKVELLANKESGDVFIFVNCDSRVKLSNLTIRTNHHLNHLIIVKSGQLVLDKCTVDSNLTMKEPIRVLPERASIELVNNTQVLLDN